MKKTILILSAFMLTLTSCPNDDDMPEPMQDQLVGTWKYFQYLENGVEQQLDPCETDETLIFNADATYSSEYFEEINGNCVSQGGDAGTWSNDGSNNYTFAFDGESENETITFDGNTFYFEFIYDFGTPDDTSDDIVERDVYIRQ